VSDPLLGSVLDLFLPRSCSICDALLSDTTAPVCADCTGFFEPLAPPICDHCGQPVRSGPVCAACDRPSPPAPRIRSALAFGGAVQEAVIKLKLGGRTELASYLAGFIDQHCIEVLQPDRIDLLVPVPLHPARLAQRGSNQSALIARALSDLTGLEVDLRHLVRLRDTPSQFNMSNRDERMRNMKDAFRVKKKHPFSSSRLALVDDVVTTGATLGECARVCLAAGARSVVAVTAARTIHSF
jgi:ComF family protein